MSSALGFMLAFGDDTQRELAALALKERAVKEAARNKKRRAKQRAAAKARKVVRPG